MLDQITKICQELLKSHPYADQVREYLDERLPGKTQDDFQMGFFPSSTALHLLVDVIGEENLAKSDLFYYRILDGEKLLSSCLENHNMVMPYKDAYGKIIGLVGRTILPEKEFKSLKISKYKNSSFEKRNHLFGLYKAKQSIIKENRVYVVEGQFDCIRAISSGIENCVCLGSSSMTFHQFAMLARYTDNIILLLDNDEAGMVGMDRAISKFGKLINIKKACVPEGYKDLDQFLESEGKRAKEFVHKL